MNEASVIYVRGKPWLRLAYEAHVHDRRAIAQFVDACRRSDVEALCDSIEGVEYALYGWRTAMRRVRRLPATTSVFRGAFLNLWVKWGDHVRQEVGDDFALIDALRLLLPPYRGRQPVTLYRGESAHSWRYRCP